jgi:hypothetical protein
LSARILVVGWLDGIDCGVHHFLLWVKLLNQTINFKEEQKMKTRKLFIIGALVCLLVGVSGTAMARNDCPGGKIFGGTLTEIVIDEFVQCVVVGATITGDVKVTNADVFTLTASRVQGTVSVENTVGAAIVISQINSGDIETKGNGFSIVYQNIVGSGNISVIGETHQEVYVYGNQVTGGNIMVSGNKKADVKDNKTTAGDIGCYNNEHLDAWFNNAVIGTVDCKD